MAKASIYLDKRYKDTTNKYRLTIRVSHKSKTKVYPIGYNCTEKDFKKIVDISKDANGVNKTIRKVLLEKKYKADELLSNGFYNFDKFEADYLINKVTKDDVYHWMDIRIDEAAKRDKHGTAASITDAKNSFLKYSPKLKFSQVNKKWLESYEAYMLKSGRSISTVGIYLRALRPTFNYAIKNGNVPKDWYPFDNYSIPTSVNVKKALSKKDVKRIFDFKCDPGSMTLYRDLWIFSYLCNGMNLKDILSLTYDNLQGDQIYFERQKSERKRTKKSIVVHLNPIAKKIIEKYGSNKEYIFPFYTIGMTEEDKYKRSKLEIKNCNKYLGRIGEKLELKIKPTFYYARHSYATVMRNLGASDEMISNTLGHETVLTTKAYLGNFEKESIKIFNEQLL